MGDFARSHDYAGDEVVKCVTNEDDWSTRPAEAEAHNEGEYYYEDGERAHYEPGEYYHEDGFNVEYSYTYDSSQQVGGTASEKTYDVSQQVASGYPRHRRRHSTSAVHKHVEESRSSQSSEEDEVKVKPKTKKKSHFHHLAEPPQDDTYSDPGYGGSEPSGYQEVGRSQSINAVTSWLHDANLREHPETTPLSPPRRPAPPRRHPRAAHPSQYYAGPGDNEARYYDKMPACDPSGHLHGNYKNYDPEHHDPGSGHQHGYYGNHAFDVYGPSANQDVYRPEAKPLEKCFNLMKIGAAGLASASKTAAIGLGVASKTAAVGLRSKSKELKNLAVPVLTPIFDAVVEESKFHLLGPDPLTATATGRAAPLHGRGRGRGPGRGLGRGAPPGARPMLQPGMMMPGPGRPGMRPVIRPPGMMPVMRPPGMRPVMRPPGMGMAPSRANMMPPPPIARGQGMAIRRPAGAARGRARPVLAAAPSEF